MRTPLTTNSGPLRTLCLLTVKWYAYTSSHIRRWTRLREQFLRLSGVNNVQFGMKLLGQTFCGADKRTRMLTKNKSMPTEQGHVEQFLTYYIHMMVTKRANRLRSYSSVHGSRTRQYKICVIIPYPDVRGSYSYPRQVTFFLACKHGGQKPSREI